MTEKKTRAVTITVDVPVDVCDGCGLEEVRRPMNVEHTRYPETLSGGALTCRSSVGAFSTLRVYGGPPSTDREWALCLSCWGQVQREIDRALSFLRSAEAKQARGQA